MSRLCLFSSYYDKPTIPLYVENYLRSLLPFHEKVILLTNKRDMTESSLVFLKDLNIQMLAFENEGYDFGMWYHAFQELDIEEFDQITLVNDSCVLINKLDGFFQWVRSLKLDCYAMSDNHELAYHFQSFFLVFDRKALAAVKKYFEFFAIIQDKLNVVLHYEIGLSRYLLGKGFKGDAFYQSTHYSKFGVNLTIYRPLRIVKDGFPLFKKSLLSTSSYSWFYRKSLKSRISEDALAQIINSKPTLHGLFFEGLDMVLYKTLGLKTLLIIR